MEISRRHFGDVLDITPDGQFTVNGEQAQKDYFAQIEHGQHDAELERMKDRMIELSGGVLDRELIQVQTADIPDAAEMQRQVGGLTRNQRRVLNKRMRKAAKK